MRKGYTLEFTQEVEGSKDKPVNMTLVIWPTARSILLEFASETEKFKKKGVISGHTPDGKGWEFPLEDAIKSINKRGVWGFYRFQSKEIHMWFRKNAKSKEIKAVLVHELGHWMDPHHRKLDKEEDKASKYEFVYAFAEDIWTHLSNLIEKGEMK
jgi:hypothetical protein